jgi:hypothetical protein
MITRRQFVLGSLAGATLLASRSCVNLARYATASLLSVQSPSGPGWVCEAQLRLPQCPHAVKVGDSCEFSAPRRGAWDVLGPSRVVHLPNARDSGRFWHIVSLAVATL